MQGWSLLCSVFGVCVLGVKVTEFVLVSQCESVCGGMVVVKGWGEGFRVREKCVGLVFLL